MKVKHLYYTKTSELYFDMLVRASTGECSTDKYLEVLVIGNLEVLIGRRVVSLDVLEYPVSEVEVDCWACDPV
jgi:hypothetical protein